MCREVAIRCSAVGPALAGVMLLLATGCSAPPKATSTATTDQMLTLLMPTRIEVVKPSTRVRSLSGSGKPEVLELLVRGYTLLENPGALLVGQVRVELFGYQPASANNKGPRITLWEVPLDTQEQQLRFWNPVIQMYEFQLGIEAGAIPPAEKYVLAVTYNTPLGQHLTDEIIFDLHSSAGGVTLTRPEGR